MPTVLRASLSARFLIRKAVPLTVWDSDDNLQHYGASVLRSLSPSDILPDLSSLKLAVSLDLQSLPIGQHCLCFSSSNMPALLKLFPALIGDQPVMKPPQQRAAQPALDCSPHDDWCLWLNGPSLKSLASSASVSAPLTTPSSATSPASAISVSVPMPPLESKRKPDPLPTPAQATTIAQAPTPAAPVANAKRKLLHVPQPFITAPLFAKRAPRVLPVSDQTDDSIKRPCKQQRKAPADSRAASFIRKLTWFLPRFRFG
jgi:hypothetical protein